MFLNPTRRDHYFEIEGGHLLKKTKLGSLNLNYVNPFTSPVYGITAIEVNDMLALKFKECLPSVIPRYILDSINIDIVISAKKNSWKFEISPSVSSLSYFEIEAVLSASGETMFVSYFSCTSEAKIPPLFDIRQRQEKGDQMYVFFGPRETYRWTEYHPRGLNSSEIQMVHSMHRNKIEQRLKSYHHQMIMNLNGPQYRAIKNFDDGAHWEQIPGGLKVVSVGQQWSVFGVNSVDDIYFWNGANWSQVNGKLKHISTSLDGSTWGVNAGDQIWRYLGNHEWEPIPGFLKQISVGGKDLVVGCNADDLIFKWCNGQWIRLPGSAKHASIGVDGDIWVVNCDNMIFHWNGNDWDNIRGSLKYIDVYDANNIVGVNANNDIFQYMGNHQWVQIGGKLKQVSISQAGIIWGTNDDDTIFSLKEHF
jgi:virginiamycin B lyase